MFADPKMAVASTSTAASAVRDTVKPVSRSLGALAAMLSSRRSDEASAHDAATGRATDATAATASTRPRSVERVHRV
jgi:hypothetical protein